jgi:hypothetical protein
VPRFNPQHLIEEGGGEEKKIESKAGICRWQPMGLIPLVCSQFLFSHELRMTFLKVEKMKRNFVTYENDDIQILATIVKCSWTMAAVIHLGGVSATF